MLNWHKAENGNRWIGFDDDCPCYFVDKDEDGWYWEDGWGFGVGGFDTAEEAKAEAEADSYRGLRYADLPPYDGELELLTLAEEAWEERREEGLW